MEVLTYSLRGDDGLDSDAFYKDAERFTDTMLEHMKVVLIPAAEAYRRHSEHMGVERLRTAEEYALELLALGALWRIYGPASGALPSWQGRLLRRLVRLRSEALVLKPAADRARGTLGAAWLEPPPRGRSGRTAAAGPSVPGPLTPGRLDRLILWLEAAGEFRQEADRFRLWSRYLAALAPDESRPLLEAAVSEAKWFEAASLEAFGRYTRRVDHYRLLRRPFGKRREDAVLRNRRREEYHLNLAGAELLNRLYRREYASTAGKAVLLPACLKSRAGKECAAVRSGTPFRCLLCSADCRIGQIEKLARAHSFEVIIAPHESDAFSAQVVSRLVRERTGIVGVACALNLVAGGWRAEALGIPAQCVLLDYCGCSAHWDPVGFPTDLNLNRLRGILGLEPAPPSRSI